MRNFKIDDEFKKLIPALQGSEFKELESSLRYEGCREPLITWRDILIDGHNRYEICRRENIPYQTREIDLPGREHVLLWIETNQLGRRNLTDDQRAAIGLSIFERRTALSKQERASKAATVKHHGEVMKSVAVLDSPNATEKSCLSDTLSDKQKVKTDTRKQVAEEAKIPERKLRDLAEVKKKNPEAITRIRQGESTIKEERNKIRREERIQAIVEDSKKETPLDGSLGKFAVIYCDPPWEYDFISVDAWKNENHYKTMNLQKICELQVQQIVTKDAILFLWATAPKLADAMQVITAWGFTYKTSAVWDKVWPSMGYYFRIQHEILLIATRGNIPPPETDARPVSVHSEKRTEHSRKPGIFYEIIEKMYPELPKIELFARQPREGWNSWGNQLKKEAV